VPFLFGLGIKVLMKAKESIYHDGAGFFRPAGKSFLSNFTTSATARGHTARLAQSDVPARGASNQNNNE
jgi:hypothetical protein